MFRKILIANRGEIACRVAATARRLGIAVVAVHSEADADARHVRMADEAVQIGPPPARDSYLRAERILEAAKRTGAEAIHPGYGFLSENEAFARACADEGLVFIGPPPAAIAAMGDKSAAKRLMEKAGVPLVPGYHGENQEPDVLAKEAQRIGYPVLIKASAGGGGKGMRVVAKPAEFQAALEGARREAQAAFGDPRVLIERYMERPRHIEVQVFGDAKGDCLHLFERDCSVQRRHQKVLEEAPAPGMSAARRKEMGEAAVAAARAVGYVGAGTVEFIAEQDGKFYFMEMNTRLQVEHPVTEMITGLDLVEWQLRVAAGEPLPLAQKSLKIHGHAIEARLYAEDPERGFLPQTGRLAHLRFPAAAGDVRVDTGVAAGASITPHYDPMIAKVIAWGEDRAAAVARLAAALAEVEIIGVRSNVAFLERVARSTAFAAADLDTGLIERCRAEIFAPAPGATPELLAAAAMGQRGRLAPQPGLAPPVRLPGGWAAPRSDRRIPGRRPRSGRRQTPARGDGRAHRRACAARAPRRACVSGARGARRARLARLGAGRSRHSHACSGPAGGGGRARSGQPRRAHARQSDRAAGRARHERGEGRPGVVKAIHFAAGEQVPEGAELLTLEAS
jgi:3-methylcrotonyl-CoA carboxylase alpha subunit